MATTSSTAKASTQYAMWLSLVNRLLESDYFLSIELESNNCLKPIPWAYNEKLCIPYGNADIPFLIRLLFKSDALIVSKALQALVERAYDSSKSMDMLRLNVIAPLGRLTGYAEPFVRQRVCLLVKVLAGQPLGKVCAVRNTRLMRELMALMADADYGVRFHCAAAMAALAAHRPGNEMMVELGCADRALAAMCAEEDRRLVPALSRTVGALMDINRDARKRVRGAVDPARLFSGPGLLDCMVLGTRSPDYRTALDSVLCMSHAAKTSEVANAYLAADRGIVDQLVFFARSPVLRERALCAFAARLLCTMATTSTELVDQLKAVADNLSDVLVAGKCASDVANRYLQELADAVTT